MPEVVCDTTPRQYLHQTGVLQILPAWYGRILIPRAVANEIDAGLKAGVNLPDLVSLDWSARASDWRNPPGSIFSSSPRQLVKANRQPLPRADPKQPR